MTTVVPADRPIMNRLIKLITGLPADTAASASAPMNRPTITESATLYSWVTIVPSRMGTAKRRRFCMIGPSVRSILCFPGVIILSSLSG